MINSKLTWGQHKIKTIKDGRPRTHAIDIRHRLWFLFLLTLFGLAAFGMSVYSVVRINNGGGGTVAVNVSLIQQQITMIQMAMSPNVTLIEAGACTVVGTEGFRTYYALYEYKLGNRSSYYAHFETDGNVNLFSDPFVSQYGCGSAWNHRLSLSWTDCTSDPTGNTFIPARINAFYGASIRQSNVMLTEQLAAFQFNAEVTAFASSFDAFGCAANNYLVGNQPFVTLAGFEPSGQPTGSDSQTFFLSTYIFSADPITQFGLVGPLLVPLTSQQHFYPTKKKQKY